MAWWTFHGEPGERRSRIVEAYESRYAAEGLERHRAIEAEDGAIGLRDATASRGPLARLRRHRRKPG